MSEEAAGPTVRISNGPVCDKENLAFEHEVIGVLLRSLLDGGGAVVDPGSVANFEHREVVGGLDELGVAALDTRSSKRVILANKVISVALTVYS